LGENTRVEFSHQIRGTITQVLASSSDDAVRTFLYKHHGLIGSKLPRPRAIVNEAPANVIRTMLVELLSANKVLRAAAPLKGVFDEAVSELRRWALNDGWLVDGGELVRVTPLAEEVTGIRDKFADDLASSGLDTDGAIRATLNDSSKDFVAQPPDLNGSITKARIALETVARRGAQRIASGKGLAHPEDKWGAALAFLGSQSVIEQSEEEILARVYSFVSPGAHVPKGVTEEEWARLSRTFSVSSAYFLLRKIMAA
jgi:hypothetical protein